MVEFRLRPKAREDLEAVWLYSVKHWGETQAGRYIDDLTEAFQFLAENAKTGMRCDHIRQGYRRHPVARHVVYYREAAYGIEIMRVLHERMFDALHL